MDTQETALVTAAESGDVAAAKTTIAEIAEKKQTALCLAAIHGHTEVVCTLLNAYTDLDPTRALCCAAQRGHVEIVDLLLAASPMNDMMIDSAVNDAAINGHAEIVRHLLAAEEAHPKGHDTALYSAAVNGHTQVVRVLLAAGTATDANKCAALCYAAIEGHVEAARALLVAGADPLAAWQYTDAADCKVVATTLDACADAMTAVQRTVLAKKSRWFVTLRAAAASNQQRRPMCR